MIGWRRLLPLALVAIVGCEGEDVTTKKMLEAERAENARLAKALERSQRDKLIERAQKPELTPQEKEEALAQEAEEWRKASEGQVSASHSADLQRIAELERAKREEDERIRSARQLEEPLVALSEDETEATEDEEETSEPPGA